METTGGSNYFEFSVSHTTRQARPSEINGVHYHFVPSVFQMRLDIDNGKFVEYAQVHGNWYGTSLEAIQQVHEKGKICLLDIDVQGVKSIKKHPTLKANYVFIAPPSLDVLKERLRNRGTENVESLQRRTENALEELEYGSEEKKNFDYFVVNDSVDRACEELKCIVRKMYPRISW